MPELPEVETIARGLDKRVRGDEIVSVWLGQKKEPLKSRAVEIVETLEGARIAAVRRMGKHIVIELERGGEMRHKKLRGSEKIPTSGKRSLKWGTRRVAPVGSPDEGRGSTLTAHAQWIVHLGMTGRMQVCSPETELEKHTHLIARLTSGREIRFVDPRRFGRLSVVASGNFEAGGIEPLEIDVERFEGLFRGRKTPIKSALLNQKLLRGVGNIYADESLFRTGIRPRRRAATIPREKLTLLHRSVQEVLKEAIVLGGSSVSDYVDADGEEGFFQLQHRVYGREGKPCLVCKTPIKRVVIAGRSSHYCPSCQK